MESKQFKALVQEWCDLGLSDFDLNSLSNIELFSQKFDDIHELLKRSNRNDSNDWIILAIHESINSIIYYSPNNLLPMIESLLPQLIKN